MLKGDRSSLLFALTSLSLHPLVNWALSSLSLHAYLHPFVNRQSLLSVSKLYSQGSADRISPSPVSGHRFGHYRVHTPGKSLFLLLHLLNSPPPGSSSTTLGCKNTHQYRNPV